MIDKLDAIEMQSHALAAVREMSQILNGIHGKCSDEEFTHVKRQWYA